MIREISDKPKVLILNEKLMEYRIPIYDLLAEKFDLTLGYSYPYSGDYAGTFQHLKLREPQKIGPIFVHHEDLRKICQRFDAVIVLGEIRRISLSLLAFGSRKYKLAFWSIGVSTGKGFDVDKKMDFLRDYIYKKADACIFYTEYARNRAVSKGYNPSALFVANNTVKVLPLGGPCPKDSFLFIGALQKRKGLDILLKAYKEASNRNDDLPILRIVGGGAEYNAIKKWVEYNNLKEKICLTGPVYDKTIKRDYFKRAYACISPRQAGLSVLEAMGYGVPFVTMNDSTTGGERLNICNNANGVLMDNESDLCSILLDVASRPNKYAEMGSAAYKYYWEKRRPEMMAQGLSDAIEYLLSL